MPPSPHCPRCEVAVTGPTVAGTRFVLCSACWTVVDPAPPPPAPPPIPVVMPVYRHEPPPRPPAPPPPPPRRPDPPAPAPEFELPDPWPRYRPLRWHGASILITLAGLAGLATLAYLLYLALRPSSDTRFVQSISPNGRFRVSFPKEPVWQVQGRLQFTGPAARVDWTDEWGRTEVYRVLSQPDEGVPFENAVWEYGTIESDLIGLPTIFDIRTDSNIGCQFVDFTWQRARGTGEADRVVGRVILANRNYVYLTVAGRNVLLSDARVRRFLDSFRLR